MFEIEREMTFSASHQLRGYKGKCERLHGHNFKVRVSVCSQNLDDIGMVMDFHELDELMRSAVHPFEHRHLNEITVFTKVNPTSENIAKVVGESITKSLKGRVLRLMYCDVYETERSRARYMPG
jgi:6-pyruvoyltetrahydropterin/6-carboxytetrahydropterin synthase